MAAAVAGRGFFFFCCCCFGQNRCKPCSGAAEAAKVCSDWVESVRLELYSCFPFFLLLISDRRPSRADEAGRMKKWRKKENLQAALDMKI